ncbi:MAG TPA: uracil-DNA glycosylase [Phycisphaerae bacterium]|nr:uracil-DNA glycosylase [Phycisphaerae bacterium]
MTRLASDNPHRTLPLRLSPAARWQALNRDIASCEKCPRLRTHCQSIARIKRAAFRDDTYWARPVPNLGPHTARLLILGLAPAAHGANRTGRLFTGDRSGDFLFAAMHATGFANQPTSIHAADGLTLIDCAITGAAHCAPPDNKPTRDELAACAPFLDQTLALMPHLRLILCLGKIAFDTALALYKRHDWLPAKPPRPKFAHAALHKFSPAPALLCSYHPSQQNTFTGKLTQPMLQQIFNTARAFIDRSP